MPLVEYELVPGVYVSLPSEPLRSSGARDGASIVMLDSSAQGARFQISATTFVDRDYDDDEIREVEHRIADALQQKSGVVLPKVEGESDGLPNVTFVHRGPTRTSLVAVAGQRNAVYLLVTEGVESQRIDMQRVIDSFRVLED